MTTHVNGTEKTGKFLGNFDMVVLFFKFLLMKLLLGSIPWPLAQAK